MAYSIRSLLVVSVASSDFESPVKGRKADALVFDLSGLNSRESTQLFLNVAKAVRSELDFPAPVFVRVSAPHIGSTREQLSAVIQPGVAGVVLTGVQESQDVRDTDVLLREFELDGGIDPGTTGLMLSIESAGVLLGCRDILAASDRVTGVVFDTDAPVANSRLVQTRSGRELDYPRSVVSMLAAAHGIAAYDCVPSAVGDSRQLQRDSERVRAFGFAGRFVTSEKQVKVINQAFTQ